MRTALIATGILLAATAAHAQPATRFQTPIPESALTVKLDPGYHHVDLLGLHTPEERAALFAAQQAGTVASLPHWTKPFSILGKNYRYTIIGQAPSSATTTTIPTIIVPIKLTISDYSANGTTPLVLDATRIVSHIVGSPIFTASSYVSGTRQFGDAMLRAEFPTASASWSTQFSPTIGATMAITTAKGAASVIKTAKGAFLATINDDTAIDGPIATALASSTYPANSYILFVTYNALEHDAFGYHSDQTRLNGTEDVVYTYTSWLEGVDSLFSTPSPTADTLAHEIAETIHDAFGTSVTLKWGDAFNGNKCFQNTIEVGDAIEDAPASVQNWRQKVTSGVHPGVYTLQNEALLPWFERQSPSTAIGGAYSFPSASELTQPAPLTCVP